MRRYEDNSMDAFSSEAAARMSFLRITLRRLQLGRACEAVFISVGSEVHGATTSNA